MVQNPPIAPKDPVFRIIWLEWGGLPPPFAPFFPGVCGRLAHFRWLDSTDRAMDDIEKAWTSFWGQLK